MPTMKELLQSIKEQSQSLMTSDSPKEFIDKIGEITKNVEAAEAESEKVNSELKDIKDLYIKAVRNEGSDTQPKDEVNPKPTPKSFEEALNEFVENKNKK